MSKDTYTELQLKIIKGEISLQSVRSTTLSKLMKKAIFLGDFEIAQKVEEQLAQNKEKAKKRNLERAKAYYHEIKKSGLPWKPAKTPIYTERQQKIIDDEIPLEDVYIRDLIAIRQKAELNKDRVLADMMQSLIDDKKLESAEKARLLDNKRKRELRDKGRIDFSCKGVLNKYEEGILLGENDLSECSVDHLYHIKEVCEKNKDENNLEIIDLLIQYVEHPGTLYIAKSHDEAMKILYKMLGLPIKRPK